MMPSRRLLISPRLIVPDVFCLLVLAGPEGMTAGAVATALDLARNTPTVYAQLASSPCGATAVG
jgi:hypothetical protein